MPNPTDEMIEAAYKVISATGTEIDHDIVKEALIAALTVTEGAWRRQLAVPPVRRRRREATINAKVIDQLTRSIQRNVRLIKTLEATKEYIISGGDQPAILARIRSTLLNEE